MKKPKIPVALLGAFLLGWLVLGTAAAQTDPLSVFNALQNAYNSDNAEVALALFADDAVFKSLPPAPGRPDTATGKQAILVGLQNTVKTHIRLTLVGTPTVAGDKLTALVSFVDDGLKPSGTVLQANVEMVVTAGKITTFTRTLTPDSVVKIRQLSEAAGSSPGVSLPASGTGGASASPNGNNTIWLIGGLVGIVAVSLIGFGWLRRVQRH
jgi:ketosteroid isomerase-like protein